MCLKMFPSLSCQIYVIVSIKMCIKLFFSNFEQSVERRTCVLPLASFSVYRSLLETLVSLQPQRSVAQGESKEDKV